MNCRAADGLLHGWLGLSKGLHASLGTSRATTSRVARVIAQQTARSAGHWCDDARALVAFGFSCGPVSCGLVSLLYATGGEEEEEVKEVRKGV